MFARRQQLENWANQRALKEEQNAGLAEMAEYTGVEYDARRATQSYFNVLKDFKKLQFLNHATPKYFRGARQPKERASLAFALVLHEHSRKVSSFFLLLLFLSFLNQSSRRWTRPPTGSWTTTQGGT